MACRRWLYTIVQDDRTNLPPCPSFAVPIAPAQPHLTPPRACSIKRRHSLPTVHRIRGSWGHSDTFCAIIFIVIKYKSLPGGPGGSGDSWYQLPVGFTIVYPPPHSAPACPSFAHFAGWWFVAVAHWRSEREVKPLACTFLSALCCAVLFCSLSPGG